MHYFSICNALQFFQKTSFSQKQFDPIIRQTSAKTTPDHESILESLELVGINVWLEEEKKFLWRII